MVSNISSYFQSQKLDELKDISNNFTKLYGIQGPVSSTNGCVLDLHSVVKYKKEQKKCETEEGPEVCLPLVSNDVLFHYKESNRTWSCIYLAYLLRRLLKTIQKQKVDIIWKRTRIKMIDNSNKAS